MNCCDYGYCQPWNSGYYQCLDKPELCPNQETDIDYYGNDLETIYGVQPDVCCDKCATTSGCAAYTFVNENPDGKTACYLKTSTAGRVEKKGAVSAAYKDFVTPNGTCTAKVGDGCGNSEGTTCCPDNGYCQPWNSGYYQCIGLPDKCPEQEVDIDYYGNDLQTIYGLYPTDCCEKCASTSGCAAYTFINENADGKTACYLKSSTSGKRTKKGAVSAVYKDFTGSTCTAKIGDSCGNTNSGPSCCPEGAFCQPWNPGYYQCIEAPFQCPHIEVGVDFYGDDLATRKGLLPESCCEACGEDSRCTAFTFVNKNDDGQSACYLKFGTGTHRSNPGAISGLKLVWID
ncbi:Cellulose binding elicitor lectin (CBEL) [Phytophthora palmivora]|uniref:Cellulose binding elicitor lectin (CBEL) n=1 Tax=Phytophthora palmivora TaxID=4796 RepID=A0A2P4Y0Y6_9STRA|nr:Cellulose binding elicitor lectin (CBEL) [Phytophthora palmivora]